MIQSNVNDKMHRRRISRFPIIFFICVMAACSVMGQAVPSKKVVQPKDFSMWHTLIFPQISGNGNWVSYQLDYGQAEDTLVVTHKKRKEKYAFPGSNSGKFAPGEHPAYFTFENPKNGVCILHLDTGRVQWIKRATRFAFSKSGHYLACFKPQSENGFLKLINLQDNTSKTIHGVQHFSFNGTGDRAALIIKEENRSEVKVMRLSDFKDAVVLSSKSSKFKNLTWNDQGTAFAFMETDKEISRLYNYRDSDHKLKSIDDIDTQIPFGLSIKSLPISFSKDGERVFFYISKNGTTENTKGDSKVKVQVWKGTDKWIYPRQQKDWEYNKTNWLSVWWPESGKFFQMGDAKRPDANLSGDQKHALTHNVLTYEPQYRHTPQSDYYCVNLETGEETLFAKKITTAPGFITTSPDGKYVAYFKKGDWWSYDLREDKHTNLTKDIEVSFEYEDSPFATVETPYGAAGWSDNNELLVYDRLDIWKLSVTTTQRERLTDGRENHQSYRIYNTAYGAAPTFRPPLYNSYKYNLAQDLILLTIDDSYNQGYAVRKANGSVETLIPLNGKASHLRKAKHSSAYIYIHQSHNSPPVIRYSDGNKERGLVMSNPHQKQFSIGETELIQYINKQGDSLKGLLHYPDDYTEGKTYPMVVHIYEFLSDQLHNYKNPSLYNGDGFNYRNYTADGYFVLEPDILIKKGNPGISATDCVVTAVQKVLDRGIIDKESIGLLGHSFGGYETAFIIGQTDLFKTAVVGAGVFDIISFYHSVGKDFGKQNLYWFENYQWRMGCSFYENREGYRLNSPLTYAQNINASTLIWTGNKDYHLNWHQSEAMYLALRRLEKEVELLVYENEAHSIIKPESQKDLTRRIKNWFDDHLKRNDNSTEP